MAIDSKTLLLALSNMFGKNIYRTDFESKHLHGGTLGDVQMISGMAEADDGEIHPYRLVRKIQKKWERHGDSHSWRREYDLYQIDMDEFFTDEFRRPRCYYAQLINDGEQIELWLEYLQGASGLELGENAYIMAAETLGKFQGKIFAAQPDSLINSKNMSKRDYAKSFYLHYRSWKEVYDYIRCDDCEIALHLRQMLIDFDESADEVFAKIEKLPIVFCHRDFWVANIFFNENNIALIDWDTAGWGYLGEDIASLIADEADVEHMARYYDECISAYYKGFCRYGGTASIKDNCVYEFILMLFGYRLIEWYKFAESPEEKELQIKTLQQIYEIGKKASLIN